MRRRGLLFILTDASRDSPMSRRPHTPKLKQANNFVRLPEATTGDLFSGSDEDAAANDANWMAALELDVVLLRCDGAVHTLARGATPYCCVVHLPMDVFI
jgi:hypothetical protein